MPSDAPYDADVPKNKALKQILAENLTALMKTRGMSQVHVAAKARNKGHEIDQTTVGRVARAAMPTTIDKIEAIAAAFELEAWQLLVPDLNTEDLPRLVPKIGKVAELLAELEPSRRQYSVADSTAHAAREPGPGPHRFHGREGESPTHRTTGKKRFVR